MNTQKTITLPVRPSVEDHETSTHHIWESECAALRIVRIERGGAAVFGVETGDGFTDSLEREVGNTGRPVYYACLQDALNAVSRHAGIITNEDEVYDMAVVLGVDGGIVSPDVKEAPPEKKKFSVARNEALALLDELGFSTAETFNDARLAKTLGELPDLCETDKIYPSTPGSMALLANIHGALQEGMELTILRGQGNKIVKPVEVTPTEEEELTDAPRKRGRPKGSTNKPKVAAPVDVKEEEVPVTASVAVMEPEEMEKEDKVDPETTFVKRRGRPKGSKNRPKDATANGQGERPAQARPAVLRGATPPRKNHTGVSFKCPNCACYLTVEVVPPAVPDTPKKTPDNTENGETDHPVPENMPRARKSRDGKMSLASAALKVLQDANKAMSPGDIVDAAMKEGYWSPGDAATPPANSLRSTIYMEIKRKGDDSRFVLDGPGMFSARA